VLWRHDDAPVPASLAAVSTIGATARAITPALRLARLERERPQAAVGLRRRGGTVLAAGLIAVGATALLGVAGAIAYVGDADIHQIMLAAKSAIFAP
jgi:hypothetical protein